MYPEIPYRQLNWWKLFRVQAPLMEVFYMAWIFVFVFNELNMNIVYHYAYAYVNAFY